MANVAMSCGAVTVFTASMRTKNSGIPITQPPNARRTSCPRESKRSRRMRYAPRASRGRSRKDSGLHGLGRVYPFVMAQFLLITTLLTIAALIATGVFGFFATPAHVAKHIFFALGTVVLGLFSQS